MAINFPTSPTTNVTTHTHNGVTYLWDGVSWVAQGSTSLYTLPTATSTVLGGIKVGDRVSISSGFLSADVQASSYGNSDVDTHLNQSNPTSGHVLSWNGSDYAWTAQTGTTYSAGTGLSLVGTTFNVTSTFTSSRATAAATTSSLADQASGNIDITAAKAYALLKIQTSHAAWVTLYTDTSSRTSDANRNITTDPLPGSGVIAEVLLSDGGVQKITPGLIGYNDDATPSTKVYAKVQNRSGSAATITVTLHYLALEG